MTEEVSGLAGLHLKFSGVGTSRPPQRTADNRILTIPASALVEAVTFRMIRLFVASA
jgi:hypothetical protein